MAQLRRCSHPYQLADTEPDKWPDGTVVTYCYEASITDQHVIDIGDAAIAQWTNVCGVQVQRVSDPSQARVLITPAYLDGPGNELGLTDLPIGDPNQQVLLRLDYTELWKELELEDTILHEFGHAIGLLHAPDGTVSCMSAYLNESVTSPEPWDVAQAQLRYGPPHTNEAAGGGSSNAPPPAANDAPGKDGPGAAEPHLPFPGLSDLPEAVVFLPDGGGDLSFVHDFTVDQSGPATIRTNMGWNYRFPAAGDYEITGQVHITVRRKPA